MLALVLVFLGGILLDLLHSTYVKLAASGSRVLAAVVSGAATLASVLIYGWVIHQVETHGITGALVLAGGATIGTLLGVRRA